jgi:hypothetical protein
MKLMETVSMLQGIAYIRGVLTQWVDDDADVIAVCKAIENRLLDEIEPEPVTAPEPVADPKPEPEPAPVVTEQEIRQAVTEWVEAQGVDCPSKPPEPEKEQVPDVEVKDRAECQKCQYRGNNDATPVCCYSEKTGKLRKIPVAECELYKDSPRLFRHVCKSCGRTFRSKGPNVKICQTCKEKAEAAKEAMA